MLELDHHNHEFDSDHDLRNNPISDETKDILISYFYSGNTPTQALSKLKENIITSEAADYLEKSKISH